jgi:hypothetical protein
MEMISCWGQSNQGITFWTYKLDDFCIKSLKFVNFIHFDQWKRVQNDNSFFIHINGIKMYVSNKVLVEIIKFWVLELATKIA